MPQYVEIKRWLSREECEAQYLKLFNTMLVSLGTVHLATKAVSIIDNMCKECWEEAKGCQCWNDI